jgi:hypothetical protein
MSEQKVIDTLSSLPAAADVASYTDEQMKQLATHFRIILRSTATYDKEVFAWFNAIGKKKYKQFSDYVIETNDNLGRNAPWRIDADFVVNETRGK